MEMVMHQVSLEYLQLYFTAMDRCVILSLLFLFFFIFPWFDKSCIEELQIQYMFKFYHLKHFGKD